jgi:hypothetical protein
MNPELAAAFAALSAAAASGDPATALALSADFAGKAAGAAPARPPMPFDVLTPAQAAAYLQLPEATVLDEANAGRLPGRLISGQWRFIHIALTEWMRSGGGVPAVSAKARVRAVIGTWKGDPTVDPMIARIEADRRAAPVGG